MIKKTEAAVKERPYKRNYLLGPPCEQLKLQEQAGKPNDRLNFGLRPKTGGYAASEIAKKI
jgi:hypothetical protein